MKGSDKRGKIMKTALGLFAERGFHGVPMTMIAEKAEVAIGTIYLYFASKDALIKELFMEVDEKINGTIQEEHLIDEPIRERYLHFTRAIIEYFIAHPLHFRYLEQYIGSPYGVSQRRDALLGKLDRGDPFFLLFEEGMSNQILKDLPMVVLFSLGIGSLMFLVRDHILGFVELNDSLIKQAAEACWDGIERRINGH